MARRTFSDVDSYVLTRTGNRSEATAALRAQWINDALKRVSGMFWHPEMQGKATETLASGTDYITPAATDIFAPRMLKVDGGQIIHPVSHLEEIENIATKPQGNPSRFYWWARTFYFDRKPTADTTILIWYRRDPGEWTTGVCVLSEVYDFVVEQYAMANALNFFREFEKAQFAIGQAQKYAGDMKLPLYDEKHNDWNAGIQVRTR